MKRLNARFVSDFQSPNFVNSFLHFRLYSTLSDSNSLSKYLVDSLGYSYQQALSTSTKLSKYRKVNGFNFDSNAISVAGFFKNHGFDDTHIHRIVTAQPRCLCSDVDKTIRPKLTALQYLGFSSSDIVRLISVGPGLLTANIDSSILPSIQILRQVMASDTHVISVLEKVSHWTYQGIIKNLLPNVDLLISYGIPIEVIRKHLREKPVPFIRNSDIFKEMVGRVRNKLGIPLDSPLFLPGFLMLAGLSDETIESKFQMFKSFGWTQLDVDTLTRKQTCCFKLSIDSIRKKLDFLMNELQLTPADLTSRSAFFSCSLEKRLVPRHKVLRILKEKGLLKKNPSFYRVICISESRFMNMFVLPFDEVCEVYAKLTACGMKMLPQQSSNNCA